MKLESISKKLNKDTEIENKLDNLYAKLSNSIDDIVQIEGCIGEQNTEVIKSMQTMLSNIKKYELQKSGLHYQIMSDLQNRFIRLKYQD